MLQDIFYIAVITLTVLTIIVLIAVLFIIIKTYKMVTQTIMRAQEKATQVTDTINELGERGSGLIEMFTQKGSKAATASNIVSALLNGYFFLRAIFSNRRKR